MGLIRGAHAGHEAEEQHESGQLAAERGEEQSEADHEKGGEDLLTLHGEVRTFASVQQSEHTSAVKTGEPAVRPGDNGHGEGDGGEQRKITGTPGEIAAAKESHAPALHDVRAGEVVVGDLLIWLEAVIHQKDHVMHDGGIPQDGPVPGEVDVVGQGRKQNGEEDHAKRADETISGTDDGRLHSSDSLPGG